jgi:hypothetical protein
MRRGRAAKVLTRQCNGGSFETKSSVVYQLEISPATRFVYGRVSRASSIIRTTSRKPSAIAAGNESGDELRIGHVFRRERRSAVASSR